MLVLSSYSAFKHLPKPASFSLPLLFYFLFNNLMLSITVTFSLIPTIINIYIKQNTISVLLLTKALQVLKI